ncbi:MAG: hypothetical protein AAB436_03385 [Patescibacteria group bacterium]
MHKQPPSEATGPSNSEQNKPEITLEAFRARFGDCRFVGTQLDDLWEFSEETSSDLNDPASELPFHNFQHHLEVLWDTMELAEKLQGDGYDLNIKVLVGVSLTHDSGFYKNHKDKEGFSADIWSDNAWRFGFDEEDVALGYKIIVEGALDSAPTLPETMVHIRGDINNTSEDYDTVSKPKTELLRQEVKQMTNLELSERDFSIISLSVLAKYVGKDLSLGEKDSLIEEWEAHVLNNLDTMASEHAVSDDAMPDDLAILLGKKAIS